MDHFVTPLGAGSKTGADWANAWQNTATWANVAVGETVWIAGGAYPNALCITPGKNGTAGNPITIRKVQPGDAQASVAGYQTSFGTSAATMTDSILVGGKSWFVIHGGARDGIVMTNNGGGASIGMSSSTLLSNASFYFIKMVGPYWGANQGSGSGAWGINLAPGNGVSTAVNNILIHGCNITGMGESLRALGWHNVTIEYCYIADSITNAVEHEDICYHYAPNQNLIIRFNTLGNSATDGWFFEDTNCTQGVFFYGNDFYCSGLWLFVTKGADSGVTTSNGPIYIYNNNFFQTNGTGHGNGSKISFNGTNLLANSYIYNNIFWWCQNEMNGDHTGVGTSFSDYNAYFGITKPANEANSITLSTMPFLAPPPDSQPIGAKVQPWGSGGDFHLTTAAQTVLKRGITITPGTPQNPNSDPSINDDMDGNTRGATGPWMIGAHDVTGTPDTTPPGQPTNLQSTNVTSNSITISWTATTDNVTPQGSLTYDVYQGAAGAFIATTQPGVTSYQHTGRAASTAYLYAVRAKDAVPNTGIFSSPNLSVTTLAPDTTPPSAPSALHTTSVTSGSIALAWTAASDNVSLAANITYDVFSGAAGSLIGSTTAGTVSFTHSGRAPNTAYTYAVRARDEALNPGSFTSDLVVTTPVAPVTPQFVKTVNSGNGTTASTKTAVFTTAQIAGNTNVVVVTYGNVAAGTITPTIVSVADTHSQTYTLARAFQSFVIPAGNGALGQAIYYFNNIAAGTVTITVTLSAAADFLTVSATEYSNILDASPVDVTASATGTGTAISSGAATPTTSGDLIFGAASSWDGVTTAGATFTSRAVFYVNLVEDLVQTTAASIAATCTDNGTNGWVAQMVAFKATAPITPPGAPVLTLGAVTATAITMTWPAVVDTGAGQMQNTATQLTYNIWRKIGAGSFAFLVSQSGVAGTNTFTNTGLTSSTAYSYEVSCTDTGPNTSLFSNIITATTTASGSPPTVDFLPATPVGTTTATLVGKITATGGNAITSDGFDWGTTVSYGNSATATTVQSGNFTANLTGLTAGTVYFYRAKAVNAGGQDTSPGNTFRTALVTTGDTRFGFSTHFDLEGWPTSLMQQIGETNALWIRDDLSTSTWEPTVGTFAISTKDKPWCDAAHAAGLLVVGILQPNSAYPAAGTPDVYDPTRMAARAAFVAQSGLVDVIEVSNEPNNDYATKEGTTWKTLLPILTSAVTAAVDKVSSTVQVIGLGAQGDQIITMLPTTTMDGVVYHPYDTGGTNVPESAFEPRASGSTDYANWVSYVKTSTTLPIWETEWGLWGGAGTSYTEDMQAGYLVRRLLIALALNVDHSFWYEFKDGAAPPGDPYGVFNFNLTSKMSWGASMRTMASLHGVVGSIPAKPIIDSVGNGDTAHVYAYTYTGTNKTVIAWWFGNVGVHNAAVVPDSTVTFHCPVTHAIGANSIAVDLNSGIVVPLSTYTTGLAAGTFTATNLPIGDRALLFILRPIVVATVPSAPPLSLWGSPTATSIEVSWFPSTDSLGNLNSELVYNIWHSVSGGAYTFVTSKAGYSGQNWFTETGLNPGTAYSYKITCTDTGGNTSAFSNIIGATTLGALIAVCSIKAKHIAILTGGAPSIQPPPTMVQHVATGMGRTPISKFVVSLPNATLNGNCLILGIQFNSAGTITSVQDDNGNAWVAGPATTNTTYSKRAAIYYATGITAGTAVVTVNFSGLTGVAAFDQAVLSEWYNVATVSALDGVAVSNPASKTAGTITTGSSGDLIYNWGVDVQDSNITGGAFNGSTITAGSGFTLLSADLQVGSVDQFAVKSTAGTITPAYTTSGSAVWCSLALALKAAAAGTAPPPGIRIVRIQHTLLASAATQGRPIPIDMQFPSSGNLLVGAYSAGDELITSVTDSVGNTWLVPASTKTPGGGSQTSAQIVYAQKATTAATLRTIHVVLSGAVNSDALFTLYDIAGAADVAGDVGSFNSGTQSASGDLSMVTVNPTTSNGLVLMAGSIFNDAPAVVRGAGYYLDSVINQ